MTESYDTAAVHITGNMNPLSLQASSARKREFKDSLREAVRAATVGVYTHDVEVTLIWYISESLRYQTHLVADLDNVMKPILDAVTGPDGVLVDDNQIQSIRASWMDVGSPVGGFDLTFNALNPDDYTRRTGLSFVEFAPDRCYMLPGIPDEHVSAFVHSYRILLDLYEQRRGAGLAEEVARTVLPIARPFPRARLGRFVVRHEREFPRET